MNNQEIINKISAITNIDHNTCQIVIKEFEASASPLSVIRNFLGSPDLKSIACTIANKSGIEANICEEVLSALLCTIKQEIKAKKIFGQ